MGAVYSPQRVGGNAVFSAVFATGGTVSFIASPLVFTSPARAFNFTSPARAFNFTSPARAYAFTSPARDGS